MTSVWPNSHPPTSSLHASLSFYPFSILYTSDKQDLIKTFLFQAKNIEEQRLRGELPNKAAGAEGRAGVREGEGV